jgi:hypothetical protein
MKMADAPSKEQFFERLGALSDDMIGAYGRDFAMGALILTVRFIAQGQPVADAATETAPRQADSTIVGQ